MSRLADDSAVDAIDTSCAYYGANHCAVQQVEQGQHVHAQLQQYDKRLAEVSAALQSAVAERDAAKRDAMTATAAAPQKTATELQVGVWQTMRLEQLDV